jgi:5-methylcytosine-specific restriction endonuclease McrA
MAISSQAGCVMKKCTRCEEEKPLSDFYLKKARGVYNSECKACVKLRNRSHYERNRERLIADAQKWRLANHDKYKEYLRGYSKERTRERRKMVLDRLGRKCACCGEDREEFLTIDHVNDDGGVHRREINRQNFYQRLILDNFDTKYELQVLCWNCNLAKAKYGYCPHNHPEGSETSRKA